MRRLIVLLCFLVPYSVAVAQTDTPTPTPTPTPTATFTPVPDLAIYLTVVAPGAAPEESQAGAVVFQVDAGEVMIAISVFGLLLVELFHLILRARGHDA